MKKIIVLYAAANRGKTTVLNKLIDLLKLIATNYEIEPFYNETSAYFEVFDKKIVVCTKGDYGQATLENITFAESYGYDIFITASRTKGSTTDEITKFAATQNAKLDWIFKENNEAKNNLIAAGLLSYIVNDIDPDFKKNISSNDFSNIS